MRVSVIIPNWNGARLLGMCLDSLARSDFDDFETFVIDNGSEDISCALIRERYPHVRLIRLDRNYGFAPACNEGIRASRGEFVVLLNNDIEVASGWLGELVAGMDRHPECALGASRMMYRDSRAVFCNAGDGLLPWGAGQARGEGEVDRGQYDREEEIPGVCAGAAIYRRTLFEDIGLFDERFHSLVEDVDLNFRARLAGHAAWYFPEARVYHIGSATLGRYSDRYVYQAHRNEWFVLLKNLPFGLFLKHLAGIFRSQIRSTLYFSQRGQGGLLFKAKLDALRNLTGMARNRHKIQSERRISNTRLERWMQQTGGAK
ncbi:MAG: glycosyltransferase family 2 protein [Nitrospina sp.]|nr:glycosyltransferase family 2 protein [Nitrospina sp.]